MKNQPIIKKTMTAMPLAIEIPPEDWKVTEPAEVKICQQPALIIHFPIPLLPPPRRVDIWQLSALFCSYNQPLI